MIYSTASVPVNPEGVTALTRAQVWNGLVRKARDARLFLPPGLCTRCDVVEESATHIVREATIAGAGLREIISFEYETKVSFFQVTGPREGVIVNELFEDETGVLQLRFYCYLGLRGKQPGGPEEQAEQTFMDGDGGCKSLAVDAGTDARDACRGQALERAAVCTAGGGRKMAVYCSMTSTATARLFIALLPDQTVLDELAAWRDAWTWTRSATPVKTERLHVTLHFLGDVDRSRVADPTDALRVPFTPFALRFVRATLWPHGIAVLEPEAVPDALPALHGQLARVVRQFGLPMDGRPYKPHVTLARRADGSTGPADARPILWQVERYALMSSTLGQGGGYTILKSYPA